MNTTIGNTQETLIAYTAGLFEGEGSVMLSKINYKQKFIQYRAAIQFTNTEPELCQVFIDTCKKLDIHLHIHTDIRKNKPNSKTCYQISITRLEDRVKFIEFFSPLMHGKKRREMDIVLKFSKRRLELYKTFKMKHGEDGRFKSGCKTSFTAQDALDYLEYKKIKDSSETTRKIPHDFGAKI